MLVCSKNVCKPGLAEGGRVNAHSKPLSHSNFCQDKQNKTDKSQLSGYKIDKESN